MRILVVDDTIAYRTIVSNALAGLPGVEIAGTANNGAIALQKVRSLKPDLVTLDIEMPEMGGIKVLEALKRDGIEVGVIVVSALTVRGGDLTMKALELGAFDFITKPDGVSAQENAEEIKRSLGQLVKAWGDRQEIRSLLKGTGGQAARTSAKTATIVAPPRPAPVPMTAPRRKAEVVGIGISTGGPNALLRALPMLPGDLGVPIAIVQHMPPLFTQSLAASLKAKCSLQVKEAEHGESFLPNCVYIAPGGKHMKVGSAADGNGWVLQVTDDPPENHCKPSVDYLFRSLAHQFGGRAVGVIMTGMGNDGVLGLRLMRRNGSMVIAQDEATCVVFGMPKEAIDAGVVDVVAPLDAIANEIVRTVR
mgnify:CR=1 FL=1